VRNLSEILIKVPKLRMIALGYIFKGGSISGVAAGGAFAGGGQGGVVLAARGVNFGGFRFYLPARALFRIGNHGSATPISLGSRAADLLHLFLHRPGQLITKSEIMDAVWPNMAVEESNLTVQISALRRALGGGRDGASYIQTVPGRGYRFTPWVNDFGQRVKEINGSATIVLAGEAGVLTTTVAPDLFPQDMRASPESIPPSSLQPHRGVLPQIP